MEVRKRTWLNADGTKGFCYVMDYREPKTGRRVRKSIKGVDDKRLAETIAGKQYRELMERFHLGKSSGPTTQEKSIRLGDFLEADLERVIAPSTRALESWRHKPLKRVLGEDSFVIELTLQNFKNYQKVRSKEVAASTVNDELAVLRAALNRAVEDGRLFRFPDKMPLPLPEKEPERRDLTEKQIESLFAAMRELNPQAAEWAEVIYLLGGLRPIELWNLTWGKVDFDHNHVSILSTKRGTSKQIRYRIIPMTERLRDILLKRREAAGEKALDATALVYGIRPEERKSKYAPKDRAKAGSKDGVVFYGNYRFGQFMKRAAARAGIPFPETVKPYCLRHSAGTNAEGADLTDVSYMMGHSDIRTTAKIYRHKKQERLVKGMESLSGHILGTKEKEEPVKPSTDKGKRRKA